EPTFRSRSDITTRGDASCELGGTQDARRVRVPLTRVPLRTLGGVESPACRGEGGLRTGSDRRPQRRTLHSRAAGGPARSSGSGTNRGRARAPPSPPQDLR